MKFIPKRCLKKMISYAGFLFFGIAAFMLYQQLSKYNFSDIKQALVNIPDQNLWLSITASLLGYIALSSYDYLALKYIGRTLETWKWVFVGFIGFSISNNAGHAIVSGGAIRYRFYTRWRFKGSEIIKMVMFSGMTYLIACFFLIIIGYILTPNQTFGEKTGYHFTTQVITFISLCGLIGYFCICLWYKKTIRLKNLSFKIPSVKMAIAQVLLGGADILMASLVLYFVLIPFIDIPFSIFIGIYIIAQILGVFSQVPGGLGVFEGLFLFILPAEVNSAYLFGALIAYRLIYYLLPLAISGIALTIYEGRRKFLYRKNKCSSMVQSV